MLAGLSPQHDSMHSKLRSSYILKVRRADLQHDSSAASEQLFDPFSHQEHLDRALALRDDDPTCFYLLGRWCYQVTLQGLLVLLMSEVSALQCCLCLQVATLDWLEKAAAAAHYQSTPTSTLHDALESFLKV